jgi:surface antigen
MSFPLGSILSDKADEEAATKSEVTGSIAERSGAKKGSGSEKINPADWSLATVALQEALAKGEEGTSVPWQNPSTGARGTVTPVANSFVQEGFACRNFLASHVGNGNERWFEGTACRVHRGEWDVRSTRPLQKS